MTSTTRHWTHSLDNFIYRIASDFVVQLEKRMDADGINQKQLAAKLGVSVGRVSQVLNNPGNLTLKKIVEYARILGMKVAVVAYDDGDADNEHGPINSEIFHICWNNAGKPHDFFSLTANVHPSTALRQKRSRYAPIAGGGMFYLGKPIRVAVPQTTAQTTTTMSTSWLGVETGATNQSVSTPQLQEFGR